MKQGCWAGLRSGGNGHNPRRGPCHFVGSLPGESCIAGMAAVRDTCRHWALAAGERQVPMMMLVLLAITLLAAAAFKPPALAKARSRRRH